MKKAMKRHGSPEAITTDGLASHKAALKELGGTAKQEVGRWANNRVENSHLPLRRRERVMQRFRRMTTLQKFASVHASTHNHFNFERHLVDRTTYLQAPSLGSTCRVANCPELRSAPRATAAPIGDELSLD